jgi:DNA modification methylase
VPEEAQDLRKVNSIKSEKSIVWGAMKKPINSLPASQTYASPSGKNQLFYGDNLNVLRDSIADNSIDLVYLDPPFNSARDYNILFSSSKGDASEAQITAFGDSWHWGEEAELEFTEIVRGGNTDVAEMIQALRKFLGENDMMAYLVMMANRLLELHRVLKPTGSIYLHCDPTASHYLKIVLDGVFGKRNLQNEIIWCYKRYTAKSMRFQRLHDVIFFYSKSDTHTFNQIYEEYGEKSGKMDSHYKQDEEGKWFRWQKRKDAEPYKIYLSEGVRLGDWWEIPIINASSSERLGYPTQKPLSLLERIIQASSNEGDVILDPFCGCGTAVHGAQKLKRQWIGIDITHLAVSLIEKRLKDAFPGIQFDVHGTPKDLEGARDLAERDKYQFQWWACSLVNAQPYQGKKKGADGGIDGLIFFQDDLTSHKKIVVSVKGGENVSVAMVRDLAHVVSREKAEIGLFITLADPTKPMRTEAIKEGYYTSPTGVSGGSFPKIQILTIAGLLSGTERAVYPDLSQGATTFKKAKREEKIGEQGGLF